MFKCMLQLFKKTLRFMMNYQKEHMCSSKKKYCFKVDEEDSKLPFLNHE